MATIELIAPHPGQLRIIREAKRFNVLECGRRFGKTVLGMRQLVKTALEGKPAGWFSPSYKLQAEVFDEVDFLLKEIIVKSNRKESSIQLTTGGLMDFWSLNDARSAGRGRKYAKIVIDEAGHVRDLEQAWTMALRPTLTDLRGGAWFLSTPHGKNYFDQLYAKGQANSPGWMSWRMGTVENPYMPKDEIESARLDLPKAAFDQEYLGIPADDGGNPFGIAAIRASAAEWREPTEPLFFGVDLAKSQDWTVVVGLDASGREAVFERWQSDWGATRTRVLSILKGRAAVVDSTGVGDPIVEDMQRENRRIESFKFTSQSKQQIMEGLAAAIHQRKIAPHSDILLSELESFGFEYSKAGVKYSSPAGLHDDAVCALALAVRHMANAAPQEIPFRLIGGGTRSVQYA